MIKPTFEVVVLCSLATGVLVHVLTVSINRWRVRSAIVRAGRTISWNEVVLACERSSDGFIVIDKTFLPGVIWWLPKPKIPNYFGMADLEAWLRESGLLVIDVRPGAKTLPNGIPIDQPRLPSQTQQLGIESRVRYLTTYLKRASGAVDE